MSAIFTFQPLSANSRAIRRAQLDFPTPPFCEAIAILTAMMTSLCWLMWACWHARRQKGWEAGSTGGENAKLLALYHAGMLCSRGPRGNAGMRASRKARRPECATARMRNCWRAIMRACSVRANAGMRACVRAERLGGENAKLLALWHVGMLGLKG